MTNEELLTALNQRFDHIDKRMDGIEERLNGIEERLDGIEEDAEISREGINTLLEWADIIGRINHHPIAK